MNGNQSTISWGGNLVGGIENIGGVEITSGKIDDTTLIDTIKKYMQDLPEAADIPISGKMDITDTNGQIAMLTDIKAMTQREVVITLPDSAATWTFDAFLTSWKQGEFVNGRIPFTATLCPGEEPQLDISTSAGMSNMVISNSAVLFPSTFSIDQFEYDATVLTAVSSVTITPTAASHTITITKNGASPITVTSGQASSAIALGAAGSRTEVEIKVQENGKVAKYYYVDILRA